MKVYQYKIESTVSYPIRLTGDIINLKNIAENILYVKDTDDFKQLALTIMSDMERTLPDYKNTVYMYEDYRQNIGVTLTKNLKHFVESSISTKYSTILDARTNQPQKLGILVQVKAIVC